jgi:hypothetical protein
MNTDETDAEIKRLRMLARRNPSSGRRRVEKPRRARGSYIVYVVLMLALFSVIILAFLRLGEEPPEPAGHPAPVVTSRASTAPVNPPPDPVAAARKVKPLEDIEKGDRVLYRAKVCIWRGWNGSISTSIITCPGDDEIRIQTGRLTPVELRD